MSIFTKQKIFFVALFAFLIFTSKSFACGFDYVSSCATSIRFNVNTVTTDYFASACAYGNVYPATLGGNITSLQVTYASSVTWESCTNNVLKSSVLYRIYTDETNKGSFQTISLSQLNTYSSPPYRTRTYFDNLNVDLLTGLQSNTNYTLELYFQIGVDSNGDGTVDVTGERSNDGQYYKSSFQTGNLGNSISFPVSVTTKNPTCKGGTNGSATVSATGGVAPFTYAWSNGATTSSVTGLKAGNYNVIVTDANGTKSSKVFAITEPAAVSASLVALNPNCGQSNGSISASGFGGTSPYTYKWNTNATTSTINNLTTNTYTVTVTDSNNCTGSANVTLSENCGSLGNYCSSASQAPWNEWIARVQLNTLDNESAKSRPDRFAVGYSDWTDKKTSVSAGQSYPLSITPGLSWPSYQTNVYFRVWIDFNKNNTFEDSEKVFEKNSLSATVTGNILIPSTALAGTTVMRVSMKKDSYPTACESFAAGEVEDYAITIGGNAVDACKNDSIKPNILGCPQNIVLTTTASTATATWTAPTANDNCTATPTLSSNYASGTAFSIGTTTVTYTAKDNANNAATCSFTVTVNQQIVGSCKKYTVQNTNDICGQTWKPYGLLLVLNNQTQYLHSDQVIVENYDTVAYIKGTYRTSTWAPVQVNVTLRGGTKNAPSGSPRTTNCAGTGADYTYFTTMTGTVNINGQDLTITRRGAAFQIGVGANLQNKTDLGADGQFTLSDNTQGEFSFKMAENTTTCGTQALIANRQTLIDLNVHESFGKPQLTWVDNTSYKNDYYEIQTIDESGNFKAIDFVNERYFDNELHSYHFTDSAATEGVKVYRIKTVSNDGTVHYSPIRTIKTVSLNETIIFPNPASDFINLNLKKYLDKEVNVLIYNALGVLQQSINVDSSHSDILNINTEQLQMGHYFIRIIAPNTRDAVQQFIISK